MIDFVFAYYFVIDPNKFLNCGLLSSSFRVFSFQLFVPSRTKVNIENSEDGINILTSESTKLNIKERNQLFRPAFQERGKEGESPRGHFIPALDKFDPARAQEILFYEISGLQHNQVLFFNFIWIPRVLEDVLGDAQKADHLPQEELSSSELCLP